MKINLMTKKFNRKIEFKSLIISILFFMILFSVIINGYFKITTYNNLKNKYEKAIQISNTSDNYQYKYNLEKEKLLEVEDKKRDWPIIFNTIYSKVPVDTLITKIKLDDNKFFISGTAYEKNKVFIFVEELKKLSFCSEVFIDDLQNNSKIIYTIKFMLNN